MIGSHLDQLNQTLLGRGPAAGIYNSFSGYSNVHSRLRTTDLEPGARGMGFFVLKRLKRLRTDGGVPMLPL